MTAIIRNPIPANFHGHKEQPKLLSGISTALRRVTRITTSQRILERPVAPIQSPLAGYDSTDDLPVQPYMCPRTSDHVPTLSQYPKQRRFLQSRQHAPHRHSADAVGAVQHDAALSFLQHSLTPEQSFGLRLTELRVTYFFTQDSHNVRLYIF